MAKKNSTDDAVATLTDAAAQEKHRKALESIPAPVFMEGILWETVVDDKAFNVRDDESYSVASNQALYNSLLEVGLRKDRPMSLSYRPNGTFLVLAGHLRTAMMREIRNAEIRRREAAGEPASPETLPFATIHGLVYTGLDREQETLIMADHVMNKDLTDPERCKEIGEFMHHFPISDAKAAIHFGMGKTDIQRMRMRYSMPTVYAQYKLEKDRSYKGAFYKVDQKSLGALYAAYNMDIAAGNRWREEGPNFRAAWDKFVNDPDVYKPNKDKENTDPRKKLEDLETMVPSLSATFGNTPEIEAIQTVIRWASGAVNEDGSAVNLNTAVENLKDYCDGLRADVVALRAKIQTLSEPAPAAEPAPASEKAKKTTAKMRSR